MMKVLGIGIDLFQISRIEKIISKRGGFLSDFSKRFAKRILNDKYEIPVFEKLSAEGDKHRCVQMLAGSWATKEALFKSLDHEKQKRFQFRDWYRHYEKNGKVHIKNDENEVNEEILLSISHDAGLVVAYVLRQTIVE